MATAAQPANTDGTYFGVDVSGVRRHRPDYQILLYMGLLILLGLIVMYAIGPQRAQVMNAAYGASYSDSYFFIKQLTSVAAALFAFTAMALVPLKIFSRYAKPLLLIGLSACLFLVIAGRVLGLESIAPETLGAYRWYSLGPLGTFQPSEMLKFGVLFFMGGFLGMRVRQGYVNDKDKVLAPLAIVMGVALFIVVLLQKDLGTGIAIVSIVLAMLFVSGMSWRRLGLIVGTLAIIGILSIVTAPHRVERMVTFLAGNDHTQLADDNSYHIRQAHIAIGTGGPTGLGIGKSVQSTGYLPEATNDSIFAVMGEMFGFVGLVAIISLYAVLLWRVLRVMDALADMRHKLLVAGVFGWIGSHIVLNITAMTGLAPLTGIPLPLLSYGGTSMLFIAAALGLVFHLSRYTVYNTTEKGNAYESISSRRGVGRTRHSGRRRYS
ncbi:FtsW/RodA/SpoVE family cell cycle protein [Candidatus Saccharibacteria bacterium]|nr:FtsW/RodA/SpoVE family cell cycle protein [Candidatus Saccharibacteria bacterium]